MFEIIYGDIVNCNTDAIVNAANNRLMAGSGVCGAIFRAAGIAELQKECNGISYCKTGDAVITKGYNLKAKYIIHTVGPIYNDGRHNEESLLRSCYRNSMKLAEKYNLKSIAFPLISSGIYGYPYDEALKTAESEINNYLKNSSLEVYLVLYK